MPQRPLEDWEDPDPDDEEDESSECYVCPSCGAAVYEDCERCPACGDYITPRAPSGIGTGRAWKIIIAAVLIATLLLILVGRW